MGKQGPCYHCGVTSTPLWRNGPPEKPVLCNACGSRWRTKGTLVNYTPLHARPEDDYDDKRFVRVKSISLNKGKEVKPPKRRLDSESLVFDGFASHSQTYHHKFITDEDTSNRSSSGSALSNSDSCAQFESADCSDLTGPAQSVVWDSMVPSRKRTCVGRPKQSSVEQLTKDLYSILQEQQASCFSGTSEDDLLLESETPMASVEFGHGSVLFRHPNSIIRDEESEASSLSVDNKRYKANDVYSRFPVHKVIKAENFASPEKIWNPLGHGMEQGNFQRDKLQLSKPQVLSNRSSALCSVDLSDVVNFEEFAKNFSAEEQKLLLKYLPSVDKLRTPDSLKNMFGSAQFKENLSSFQELLAEGIFDLSGSRDRGEENKTLKKFVLSSFMKCKWVEHHQKSKESKNTFVVGPQESVSKNADNFKKSTISITQKSNFPDINSTSKMENRGATKVTLESKELLQGSDSSCLSTKKAFLESKELLQGSDSSCLSTKKAFLESKQLLQGSDSSCLSTKKGCLESKELLQGSDSSCLSTKKGCLESKETRVGDSSCFNPRTLFMPRVGNGLMVDSFQFSDENSDQDLLLDVPSSGSFPQAELLIPSASSSSGYLRRVFP